MPEGIEIEYYRRAGEAALDREVASVVANDLFYLKGDTTAAELETVLVGERFVAARRLGKLMLLDVSEGSTIGLRYGMTGRLIVDDTAVIETLEYSSDRNDAAWDRFRVEFVDGGALAMRDPRRLGGVELNPDLTALGVDLYQVKAADLARVLAGSSRPLKARLLDQSQIAGLGNLLVDETLWRAGLDPAAPANALNGDGCKQLLTSMRAVVRQLTARGGSHMGDLQDFRFEGARCPRDGAPLVRHTIGGRTTYSCSEHQAGKDTSSR